MKITDLPPKSQARKKLMRLSPDARNERLRCAQEALDTALWLYDKYKDSPEQWLRCEQVLGQILKDHQVWITWWQKKEGANGR